ncbi:hypothetical protein E2C01_018725 [Portunus trituberculatus]|uniref:Uncharacterized protein n=1 Tax=Portunus trituberculatus TaxID=210409 RepID=A0A5B7DWF5_PORTR|nr:hypothetical protein [Portunus trituberculatus]
MSRAVYPRVYPFWLRSLPHNNNNLNAKLTAHSSPGLPARGLTAPLKLFLYTLPNISRRHSSISQNMHFTISHSRSTELSPEGRGKVTICERAGGVSRRCARGAGSGLTD